MKHVHRIFAPRILAYIRKRFPGLSDEHTEEAVMDVFSGLYVAVRNGKFDIDPPLEAFLFSLARRKAIDHLRQQQGPKGTKTLAAEDIGDFLIGSEIGDAWKDLVQKDRATRITRLFLEFIASLPRVQRQVAQVMAENFPDKLEYAEYLDIIQERTGSRPTSVQVKSALSQIRLKFHDLIISRGV
jgi:DNA-directed RNA polymerase specialized sigma24 family protein